MMKEMVSYRIKCNKCNNLLNDPKMGNEYNKDDEWFLVFEEGKENTKEFRLNEILERVGWTYTKDDVHLCETCSEPKFSMTLKNLATNEEFVATGTTKLTASIKLWDDMRDKE